MKPITTLLFLAIPLLSQATPDKPNVVYLMSDELAYYELAHMGNPFIKTPVIVQFAGKAYASLRLLRDHRFADTFCNLMTQAWHASVRANDGGTPLRADLSPPSRKKATPPEASESGVAVAGIPRSSREHGFDLFFGYYDQVHAHSFYPPYLIRNSEEVHLPGNDGGRSGRTYAQYPIVDEALRFIEQNKDTPFFCYLPFTPPHGMYDVPENEPAWKLYEGEKWMNDPTVPQDAKNYAVMVSMIDRQLGQVLALLKKLKIEKTLFSFLPATTVVKTASVLKTALAVFSVPTSIPGQKSSSAEGKAISTREGCAFRFWFAGPVKSKPGK